MKISEMLWEVICDMDDGEMNGDYGLCTTRYLDRYGIDKRAKEYFSELFEPKDSDYINGLEYTGGYQYRDMFRSYWMKGDESSPKGLIVDMFMRFDALNHAYWSAVQEGK